MRIALFSEVYWPMVSGVGVTLLRLTKALQQRGHVVRVYSASYALPPGQPDRPEVHRSPSVPLFLYPDVQWAFPRQRDIVEDLRAFQPDVAHVATEFAVGLAGLKAARQLRLPVIASAHTDYDKYAARYGVEWARTAGVALSAVVLRPGLPGALSLSDVPAAPPEPRSDAYRHLEPGSGPSGVPPPVP